MKTGSAKALKSLLWGAAFLFAATAGAFTAANLAPAGAATLHVLHRFCSRSNCTDGALPFAGLIMDGAGNLYGTTFWGGNSFGDGVAFELTPTGTGWKETVLHRFCSRNSSRSYCTDGALPFAGLVMDGAGNLYGTTSNGGNSTFDGVVFELMPTSTGWKEKVLHRFCSRSNCADGAYPDAGLIMDAAGNLYGTTTFGGNSANAGVAFELSPTSAGWRETVLHDFCSRSDCTDGGYPQAGLIMDSAGNLYGTTYTGGNTTAGGIVFELTHTSTDWRETVLHVFCSGSNCTDGAYPDADLIMDRAGNLYGTTYEGGNTTNNGYGSGVAFELMPTGTGWREKVLHDFCLRSNCTDGAYPNGLVMDSAGNLYGTTFGRGSGGGGVVFALSPTGTGWRETVLHDFCSRSNCTDGAYPNGLVMDSAGNLYGTTQGGGSTGYGVAFAIVP